MRRAIAPAVLLAMVCSAIPATADTAPRTAADCSATDEQIYTPPRDIAGKPGDVLACAPTKLTFPGVDDPAPAKAWKLQYHSTTAKDEDVAVSGFLAVPEKKWTGKGPRPVVAFNHGTTGLGLQCAYSKQMSGKNVDAYEKRQVNAALDAGFAVVATDGVGYLNGQGPHYMVGRTAGKALLDSARAASRVPGSTVDAKAPVGLWGYSEGGQATLWAAQLAKSYAAEVNVAGSASGGVPGDLKMIAHELNGGQFAGFAAAALVGFRSGYPDMPFDELLNDKGVAAIKKLRGNCLIKTIFGFAGEKIEDYTKDHLTIDEIFALNGPDGTWGEIAESHKVGVRIGTPGSGAEHEIGFPVFQYRGENEQIIPIRTEDETHRAYCEADVPTQWKVYPGGDHLSTASTAIPDVLAWLGDRFAGKRPTSNC